MVAVAHIDIYIRYFLSTKLCLDNLLPSMLQNYAY